MLKQLFAFLGCSYSTEERRRFYGVRYERRVLKIFGSIFRDYWKKVGWSDGTEDEMFPAPKRGKNEFDSHSIQLDNLINR